MVGAADAPRPHGRTRGMVCMGSSTVGRLGVLAQAQSRAPPHWVTGPATLATHRDEAPRPCTG